MKLVAMMTSATFPFTLIFVSIGILTGEFNDLVEILYSQLIEVQYLYVLSFSWKSHKKQFMYYICLYN